LPARSALVTGYLLPGGTHQIFVTGNYNDAQGNGIAFGGFYACIAVIETGFDVELP
jgi:hypothetical protein